MLVILGQVERKRQRVLRVLEREWVFGILGMFRVEEKEQFSLSETRPANLGQHFREPERAGRPAVPGVRRHLGVETGESGESVKVVGQMRNGLMVRALAAVPPPGVGLNPFEQTAQRPLPLL